MNALLPEIWAITLELAPWLLLGTLASALIHAWLPQSWIRRHLSGRVGVVKAVLFGVPLPLCSCGVIPAGLGLRRDGASQGASVGFLISTPQTGVDSTLVAAAFLGWPFALFKLGAAAVTGMVGGWLTDWACSGNSGEPATSTLDESKPSNKLAAMWQHAEMLLRTIWLWLVVGVVLSAAITTFMPPGWVEAVRSQSTLVALLGTLLISLPMYVCATASVPIAAALVSSGLPAGAALVFLMAGPATNLATIGAIYRGLGGRALLVYLATLVTASVGLGYSFQFVLPEAGQAALHSHGAGIVSQLSAIVLLVLLAWFAAGAARNTLSALRARSGPPRDLVELPVAGMTCGGCASRLTKSLLATPGVRAADVQLQPGLARVRGQASVERLRAAIEAAGFRCGGQA